MSEEFYIRHIPKPLLKYLANGDVLPVLGSGFSKNAVGLPLGKKMPLWFELGEQFASLMDNYQYNGDPTTTISEFETIHGRTTVVDYLKDFLYVEESKPGKAHLFLAELPFEQILTTNFDNLIEKAYKEKEISYRLVYDSQGLSTITRRQPTIVKIHGDLYHHGSIIITHDDYKSILNKNRGFTPHLLHWFTTKTLLFIGYSLNDPDFVHLLRKVGKDLKRLKRQSYVLLVNPTQEEIARYSKYKITSISLPGSKENYDEIIASTLQEIVQYLHKQENHMYPTDTNALLLYIEASTLNKYPIPSNIKKKAIYECLFGFVKEAMLEKINTIFTIQKSKESHDKRNSLTKYFPIEQQFLLYDMIEYLIEGHRTSFEKLSSYIQCKEIMNEDPLIAKQIDTYHHVFGMAQRFSHWTYISHILKKIIYTSINNNNFDINIFTQLYLDLECFLTNNTIQFSELSPLDNISLIGAEHIELNDRLSIRSISESEQLTLRNASSLVESSTYQFQYAKYVIEYKFSIRKKFENNEENNEDQDDYPPNIQSIFASVIAALRLFRSGYVGTFSFHKMIQLDIPLYPISSGVGSLGLGIGIGEYYTLESNQFNKFRKFWDQYGDLLIKTVLDYKRYENDKYSHVKIAMENFIFAYENKHGENAYLDFMKSLISLMLLDSESQTTSIGETVVRRCSNLLKTDSNEDQVEQEVSILFNRFNEIITGKYTEQYNLVKARYFVVRCFLKYLDAMRSETFSHESFITEIDS